MYRVEDYPQIRDNFFLKARNIGASRKLIGDIEIIVCFMKKKPTDFPKSTRERFTKELYTACDWLQSEAKRYGKNLTFKYRFFTIDTPEDAIPSNGYNLIKDYFNSNKIDMDELQNRYEKMSASNESPFILVFDEVSRSFAHEQPAENIKQEEVSIVFEYSKNLFHWSTIAHELLHQFGAMDYYYPKKVTECAEIYFKNSIMGIGSQNVLDDLTAYLVGIKDTISAASYHFLNETMWVNYELYCKHISDAWKVTEAAETTDTQKATQKTSSVKKTETVKKTVEQTSIVKKKTRNEGLYNFTSFYANTDCCVKKINVSKWKIVKAGDVLATVRVGDCDIVIKTDIDGRVYRIYVEPGKMIMEGTLLVTIEHAF